MSATREDVLNAAREWLDTPFHHCADVKGAGVDCAMLLVRVFCDLGLVAPFDPRPYQPQWFEHQDEPKFLDWLTRVARPVAVPQPADVITLRFGKQSAHGAIVVNDTTIIHAYLPAGRVVLDDRRGIRHRVTHAYTVFP